MAWTKVYGRVEEVFDIDANEMSGWVEFRIVAEIDGRAFWASQMVSKIDLEDAEFNLYGFILDEMVKYLDGLAA